MTRTELPDAKNVKLDIAAPTSVPTATCSSSGGHGGTPGLTAESGDVGEHLLGMHLGVLGRHAART